MLTEVAEEKKAWKTKRRHYQTFEYDENMVEFFLGMLWCMLYYGNSKGNMGNQ